MKPIRAAALLVAAALSADAGASPITFDWNTSMGAGTSLIHNGSGTFQSIHAEFNPTTNVFKWVALFSTRQTQGFTLYVKDGGPATGNPGALGLLYFDATTLSAPKVTAYNFNGSSSRNSYMDGNFLLTGNQTPDNIHSALNPSWIMSASAVDVGATGRMFTLTIDASAIRGHTPMYPGPNGISGWSGIGFVNTISFSMRTFRNLTTSYTNGLLTPDASGWNALGEGWFQGNNWVTSAPLPSAAGLGGLGLLVLATWRRRR